MGGAGIVTDMEPTEEQAEAVSIFSSGLNLVVQARAGTGKTTQLRLMAESTSRVGQYVSFNKAVAEDAARVMPSTVRSNTAHSLAFRAVGRRYAHRIGGARMRSMDVARLLKVDPLVVDYDGIKKVLQPSYLASLATRAVTNFCFSDAAEPSAAFIPYVAGIDGVGPDGHHGWANNRVVRDHLEPAVRRVWADMCDPNGRLRYAHDCYLKSWQLSGPIIEADYVLLDEAQDCSPVLLSIFEQQTDAQRIATGDSAQQLYAWRGALDALAKIHADAETHLTRSFRFGPRVAELANRILALLGTSPGLSGTESIDTRIEEVEQPDCVLTRTNAVAMRTVLRLVAQGRRVHLVGGGGELAGFARAAVQLQTEGVSHHPELACFTSWAELQAWVEQDPAGDELALLVKLVDEFGADAILAGLEATCDEPLAEVVVSTGHRSKGREWPTVQLADDFPDLGPETPDEEYRLLYVAATRAREVLDVSDCAPLRRMVGAVTESRPVLLLPS